MQLLGGVVVRDGMADGTAHLQHALYTHRQGFVCGLFRFNPHLQGVRCASVMYYLAQACSLPLKPQSEIGVGESQLCYSSQFNREHTCFSIHGLRVFRHTQTETRLNS